MQSAEKTKTALFTETFELTSITEFGVSWEKLSKGELAPPPQGARFDLAFTGNLTGDRINGTLTGIDFANIRADGRFELNIQVTITTDDGASISLQEDGVLIPSPDGPAQLFLNMKFNTGHEKYTWLNGLQVWGRGEVDQVTGKGTVSAFTM